MKRSQFTAIFDPLDAFRADLHAVLESLPSVDHAVTDSTIFRFPISCRISSSTSRCPARGKETSWLCLSKNFVFKLASGELSRSASP